MSGTKYAFQGDKTLLQAEGTVTIEKTDAEGNSTTMTYKGIYEYIIDSNGDIEHAFFVKNGVVNGILQGAKPK